ncbi:MAG: hypothetical protein ACI9HH_002534, partial [Pseudomonadota bacterium]
QVERRSTRDNPFDQKRNQHRIANGISKCARNAALSKAIFTTNSSILYMAGGAVLIAAVSGQFPCKQGIFQGISRFFPFAKILTTRTPCAGGVYSRIP